MFHPLFSRKVYILSKQTFVISLSTELTQQTFHHFYHVSDDLESKSS